MKPLHASPLAPWSALIAGMLGEALHHQVLSDMLRYECRLGNPLTGLLAAVGVLVLMAAGAWLSWAAVRGGDASEPRVFNRRFIAKLGLMTSALLAVAVAWQTLAMFMVPPCPK